MINPPLLTLSGFCEHCHKRLTARRPKSTKHTTKLDARNFAFCHQCVMDVLNIMHFLLYKTQTREYSHSYPGHETRMANHSTRVQTQLQGDTK